MAHITACSPSPLQNFDLDLTKLDLGKSVPAVFQRGVPVPWTPRAARALPDTYERGPDRHQNVATHTFISLEMKGVKLDGKEGLPEEVRQNFGSAVQHLKIHKDDLVIKAQTFMFLIHNVSDQESSKIKAMNAGVISVVRND